MSTKLCMDTTNPSLCAVDRFRQLFSSYSIILGLVWRTVVKDTVVTCAAVPLTYLKGSGSSAAPAPIVSATSTPLNFHARSGKQRPASCRPAPQGTDFPERYLSPILLTSVVP